MYNVSLHYKWKPSLHFNHKTLTVQHCVGFFLTLYFFFFTFSYNPSSKFIHRFYEVQRQNFDSEQNFTFSDNSRWCFTWNGKIFCLYVLNFITVVQKLLGEGTQWFWVIRHSCSLCDNGDVSNQIVPCALNPRICNQNHIYYNPYLKTPVEKL